MRRADGRCSFCGKTRDKVRRLVAGPGVFICDECVALCNEIVNEPPPASGGARAGARVARSKRSGRPWWRRLFQVGATASA